MNPTRIDKENPMSPSTDAAIVLLHAALAMNMKGIR